MFNLALMVCDCINIIIIARSIDRENISKTSFCHVFVELVDYGLPKRSQLDHIMVGRSKKARESLADST